MVTQLWQQIDDDTKALYGNWSWVEWASDTVIEVETQLTYIGKMNYLKEVVSFEPMGVFTDTVHLQALPRSSVLSADTMSSHSRISCSLMLPSQRDWEHYRILECNPQCTFVGSSKMHVGELHISYTRKSLFAEKDFCWNGLLRVNIAEEFELSGMARHHRDLKSKIRKDFGDYLAVYKHAHR